MGTIFHVDVNSAFLSWTAIKQLQEKPGSLDLRTVPSAVGGDVETRHGIITAKSIPAKKYGIQTGEPVVKALAKCPNLILVKSDFATYRKYSALMMALLRTYTPYLEQASIDEAYLDVSGITASFDGDIPALGREIADRIKNELGFTVNVGISDNKFLAKMASDFGKPDKIHTLYPGEIQQKLWPLPIERLHGCGSATAKKLHNIGIHTIKDAAMTDLVILQSILGNKAGSYIHERANGRDNSKVEYQEREAKSYSNETTTAVDINQNNYEGLAIPILEELCQKVSARLQKDHVRGATVSVTVKTGNFQRHSRQATLSASTDSKDELFSQAKTLMYSLLCGSGGLFSRKEVIRLIGVGVSNLDHGENQQMTLQDWMRMNEVQSRQKEKNKKLDRMLEIVQQKYGEDVLRKGSAESHRKQ